MRNICADRRRRFDLGMLMGCVVVTHQMQRLLLGCFPVDLLQEIKPLDVAMTLLTGGDDLAIQGAQGSEQRGRAMALVVLGPRRVHFSEAIRIGCGPVPELGSFRRSTAPARALARGDKV
ncbi:hypothetical protein SAMN05216417_1145 [Nitrosospira multiformis]|uniref:Uncharacterized protein n=1 Tax=Nitrosospira multiformis TaxID=1231 RepID=A0A1I7I3Q2_9PROT|nr:hypothetical protein SAMN05216417_1145 [Nitrosospira multiformis]